MKRSKLLLSALFLIALASCAGFSTTVVPDTNFAPGASVQAAISTYYRNYAVEYDAGPCLSQFAASFFRISRLLE